VNSFKRHCQYYLRDNHGVTAIEFAVLAPVFIVFILSVIEFARMQWVTQTLNDVTYFSARCAATNKTSCGTLELIKQKVQSTADDQGISVSEDNIVVDLNVICSGINSHKVRVDFETNSPMKGLVPIIPENLVVESCYPVSL